MKILVYGAGVLGCNLARNLFRAGKDVTLLARGNWAEEIRRNGLQIKDVGAYFAVSDAKSELSLWDSRLQVTSRGYMLGYNDLRDPSVSGFFRFLAKVGDGMMKMQIVKIRFGGKQ